MKHSNTSVGSNNLFGDVNMPATMYSLTNYLRPSNHQDTSCGQNRIIFDIADTSVPYSFSVA